MAVVLKVEIIMLAVTVEISRIPCANLWALVLGRAGHPLTPGYRPSRPGACWGFLGNAG